MEKLFMIICFLFPGYLSHTQEVSCKVLKPEISGFYEGGCKNGLANGKGIAKGVDKYEGNFKNGLPNGQGVYTWENGEVYQGEWKNGLRHGTGIQYMVPGVKESAMSGIWSNDKFKKNAALEKPYKITYKNNIGRMNIFRIGDGNTVRLKFSKNGRIQAPSSVNLFSSNGTVEITQSFTGFMNVTFPMEGSVKFSAMNDFGAAVISSELRFEINQPGSWEILISY